MGWTDPRTWLAGEKLTAALLNLHLRDQFKAIGDPWTAYTPTWAAATTNPVIGNGTITGAYRQTGKFTTFRIRIVMGSTTTYGSGAYTLSLPATAANIQNPGVCGHWFDGSPTNVPYPVMAVGNTTGVVRMVPTNATSFSTATFPFTLGTGDEINLGGTYEAA